MAHFDNSHRRSKQQFYNNSQNPDVIYRNSRISGEDSSNGQVTHETFPVVPENPLEVSPIIGQKDAMFRDFEKASDLVEKIPQNVLIGCPLHAEEHNLLLFTDASVKGWGAHLGELTVRGIWSDTEANLHINILELKAFFGNEVLSNPSNEQEGSGGLRQCHSSVLPQQARRDPLVRNVSNDLAPDGILQPQGNFAEGSTHPGLPECNSRQSFT